MGIALTAESRRGESSRAQAQVWRQAADGQRLLKRADHNSIGIGVNLDRESCHWRDSFEFDTPRFESFQPSQPQGSLAVGFRYSKE
jgi:hypothetical protein